MPQYHDAKSDRFEISIKPKRNLLKWLPYFVGDRVSFKLQMTDPTSLMDSSTLHLFEIFNGEEKTLKKFERTAINGTWNNIVGNPIDREGDVIYKLGGSSKSSSAQTIFSAHASNKDRWSIGCAGLIIGGVVTFIITVASGIILGILEIDKMWHIINPFWK
jgi:hypothetical protein